LGKSEDYTGKDTGFSFVPGHDLSQVVKAWPRLNAVLKAAIGKETIFGQDDQDLQD
jgi:hypothetical protein